MIFAKQMFLSFAALLVFNSVQAQDTATSDNPYTVIISRNIFSLVPMPTNPPVDPHPSDPPPKITPNGIMSLFGQLQVLFKVAVPAKAGKPANPDQSYVLSAGERQDDIEVTKIDGNNGLITFDNHGVIQELSLTNANISTPAPSGGGPSAPGFIRPPGSPVSPGAAAARFGGGRFGGGRNVGNPSTGNNPNTSTAPSFGGAVSSGVNNSQSQEALTPEAAAIMMEAQRQKWQSEGNPALPLIPPPIGGGEPPAP